MSTSARRALHILETVAAADQPIGVSAIGRQLDMPPGTAFRGLDALERAGYLMRYQASSKYVLGGAVSALRQNLFARFAIRDVGLPYLRQLAFACGETAALTVRIGWYGLRIAAAPGRNEVTSSPPLGDIRLLGDSGAGRAILAGLGDDDIARCRGFTLRHGRAWPAAHDADLAAIRARGFAVEPTAFAKGRAALACPIAAEGRAVAAIAIEGPVLDLTRPDFHDDLPQWRAIVVGVERLGRAHPALFAGPFDHLDCDGIVMG